MDSDSTNRDSQYCFFATDRIAQTVHALFRKSRDLKNATIRDVQGERLLTVTETESPFCKLIVFVFLLLLASLQPLQSF